MLRPAGSLSPLLFGRRAPAAASFRLPTLAWSDDIRLFLFTYAAGFLGVSFFIA